MAVVTVSRELGSGGDSIAARVAERLGYELVDRRLVAEVAALTGSTEEEVERFDEKGEGRVRFFLKRLLVPEFGPGAPPVPTSGYFPEFGLEFPYLIHEQTAQAPPYLDRGTYQLLITTLVQDAGKGGRAVTVGRASQVILAGLPEAVHVKITAPLTVRRDRIMAARDLTLENAEHLIEQHDRWRRLYLHNYYGMDWDAPLLYHLIINTGRVTEAAAAEMIVDLVERAGIPAPGRPASAPGAC